VKDLKKTKKSNPGTSRFHFICNLVNLVSSPDFLIVIFKDFFKSLNLQKDCMLCDGRCRKLLCCEQQLCLAHGLHLAVGDVLCKKPDSTSNKEVYDNDDCD
jgi:hypothetical protein